MKFPFSLPGAAYDGADYARTSHDVALDEAVALIPADARVSANNNVGAQLAARRVAYIFPYFAAADWVIVDQRHPFFYDKEDEKMHSLALGRLLRVISKPNGGDHFLGELGTFRVG